MIEMQIEAAKNNGDPVTYQNHYRNFAPHALWLILAYFSAPNLGLLGLHAILKWQK
ncbi:signal peptide protein [Rhodopirellula europaea SH398]|uniref:Signal peptide protein n=2 Tax=Rhodopirellula TaxID=265488 RepID=M5SAK6_9BACT|nr:signal peptide protein [Rhodopirellula europaea SH398]